MDQDRDPARPDDSGGKSATATRAAGDSPSEKAPEREKAPARERQRSPRRFRPGAQRRECRFCREKVDRVDYKDTATLEGLLRGHGKIMARQRSGNCARHQHMVKRAIKRARYLGLLGYDEGPPRGARARTGRW